jgi:hypothetical protein
MGFKFRQLFWRYGARPSPAGQEPRGRAQGPTFQLHLHRERPNALRSLALRSAEPTP